MTAGQAMQNGGYTDDGLFGGRIQCRQRSTGYRFSLDAVLLANFISPRPRETVLDLGCGCGVISLILAYLHPACRITGLEIQPELADLARENVGRNNWRQRVTILQGDLRRIEADVSPGAFDWVVSNPPYRRKGTGRVNAEPEQLIARHETMAEAADVMRAAAWSLKNRGKAAFIYPAARGATVIYEMKRQGLEPKRMQPVYSYPGSPATLLLIEALKGGGEELDIMPPFYVYRERHGEYSPEMAACYLPQDG